MDSGKKKKFIHPSIKPDTPTSILSGKQLPKASPFDPTSRAHAYSIHIDTHLEEYDDGRVEDIFKY
jgi:hypothetical protein